MMAAARVATAYTGGSGLAEAVRRFGDEAHAEVVAVTLDLGQGKALEAVRDRALSAGAARAHVLDVRDEFARGFLLPALRAGALHRDGRSRAPALRRALAAAKLVEIARIEQAAFLAHGWAGDDGAAFERTVRAIDPRIGILRAPGLLDPSAV